MNFFTMIPIYRSADDEISLRDVWTISDGELDGLAELVWKRLREERDLAALHREVAWASQALTEFADLVGFTRSSAVRAKDGCYLYFEAVSALREATVGIVNGSPRAATGLLRSVMEMLLLHCWWQERLSRKGNAWQFYEWLKGRRRKPKIRDVVADNFEWLGLPADGGAIEHVYRTYDQLCSYVHAPIRDESFTMMNWGNVGFVRVGILRHWLAMVLDVLRISLEQLVHVYPQCLFPMDIRRKFGFNPPVGMYFDEHNFVPLATALGKNAIGIYQARLKDHEIVDMAMRVYESRPGLTPEEVLDTWQNDDTEISVDAADDSVGRWLHANQEPIASHVDGADVFKSM